MYLRACAHTNWRTAQLLFLVAKTKDMGGGVQRLIWGGPLEGGQLDAFGGKYV